MVDSISSLQPAVKIWINELV